MSAGAEAGDTTKPGLYYGVVSILVGNETKNDFGHGFCSSGAEFIGLLLQVARRRNPHGPITNTAYYRVPESEVLDAAARLKGGA